MPKVKMLRSLPLKGGDEKDERYEGLVYDVSKDEYRDLIRQGVAVDPASEEAKALVVDEKGVRRLVHVSEVPVPLAPPPDPFSTPPPPTDDLESKTAAELKDIATTEGATVTSQRRDDLLKAIRAARLAKAGK